MDPQDLVVAVMVRMGAALIAGSLIGLERELRDKSAGFRTMVFICTGAALLARRNRLGENFHVRWTVRGSRRTHEHLVSVLLADPSIKELSY